MFSKTNPLYQYYMNSLIFSILYKIFQSTRQNLDRRLAEWSEKIRIRQILCRSERDWIEVSLKFKIFPFESIIAKMEEKKYREIRWYHLSNVHVSICDESFLWIFCWQSMLSWTKKIIFTQIDWRKAKKEKIHRIYDEYRKTSFPREIGTYIPWMFSFFAFLQSIWLIQANFCWENFAD